MGLVLCTKHALREFKNRSDNLYALKRLTVAEHNVFPKCVKCKQSSMWLHMDINEAQANLDKVNEQRKLNIQTNKFNDQQADGGEDNGENRS